MMDKENPLWLPKGSIRALLAASLVGAIVYLAVGSGGSEVPGALTTLAGVVVTYYFKTRETIV